MENMFTNKPLLDKFLLELQNELTDPIHKRLIGAYRGDDPVSSMEYELTKILLEILDSAS